MIVLKKKKKKTLVCEGRMQASHLEWECTPIRPALLCVRGAEGGVSFHPVSEEVRINHTEL